MKYGTWNTATYTAPQVDALQQAGYSPLTARVLCSRGITTAQDAARFLACDAPLCDPFLLREMDAAAARILQALEQGEKIAIYGDYDVDGITATCAADRLSAHLRRQTAATTSPAVWKRATA